MCCLVTVCNVMFRATKVVPVSDSCLLLLKLQLPNNCKMTKLLPQSKPENDLNQFKVLTCYYIKIILSCTY